MDNKRKFLALKKSSALFNYSGASNAASKSFVFSFNQIYKIQFNFK